MFSFGKLTVFIRSLDEKELERFMIVVGGIILLIASLLLYRYYSTGADLERKLRNLNSQRSRTVQQLLGEREKIQRQQEKVDDILAQDKNFKIKQYFITLLQELNLLNFSSKEPEISSADLVPGYAEVKLDATFRGLNIKQLIDLLYKIEQSERVYTKDIKIVKDQKSPTIDASLIIATFEATEKTL